MRHISLGKQIWAFKIMMLWAHSGIIMNGCRKPKAREFGFCCDGFIASLDTLDSPYGYVGLPIGEFPVVASTGLATTTIPMLPMRTHHKR
jgi:hypothetical protein